MRVLLTRPVDEAQRTANRLRMFGFEPLVAPVLDIEPLSDAPIGEGPWGAVIMTSGNAARALMTHARCGELAALPLFAVGHQTAAAGKIAGFTDIVSSDGDSGDLVRLLTRRIADHAKPLLYLAGNDIARDLAGELATRGVKVETVVLYRASAMTAFTADVVTALQAGDIDAVMHYSRRSTAIFVDCARSGDLLPQIKALRHFCLSERAAEPLRQAGTPDIRIARKPNEQALMDLLLHS